MKNKIVYQVVLVTILFTAFSTAIGGTKTAVSPKYKTLIVNGQNNHNWKIGSASMKQILEGSGLFTVDVATSPEKGADMSKFKPNFSAYDLIVLDYNGDDWCDETKSSFLSYVKNGGGVFVLHAADNSFSNWKEYNEVIGLGGWGHRDEKSGPYVYMDDNGKVIRDNSPGKAGGHGSQTPYIVKTRESEHPIMKGLPAEWLHAPDELYHGLRGPAENMTILATAYSDKENKGLGRNEPILMTIKYGKGRVFHTVMGHASEKNQQMKCAGFIVTSLRGAEWAASGKVTQAVPKNLLSKTEVRLLEDYKIAKQ